MDQLQKSESQRSELMLPQISEKEKFEMAISSQKIGESGEEAIRQALRYAMVKIGLRGKNFPTGIEKFLLIRHVHENFAGNTCEEIKLAFDWAISGRLEEDYNCFENFSCAYFSRIMNAYNTLANSAKEKTEIRHEVEYKPEERKPDMSFDEFINSDFAKKLLKAGVEIPKGNW